MRLLRFSVRHMIILATEVDTCAVSRNLQRKDSARLYGEGLEWAVDGGGIHKYIPTFGYHVQLVAYYGGHLDQLL